MVLGVFAVAVLFYILTDSGRIQTIDVAQSVAVSQAILHGHVWVTGFSVIPGGGVVTGVGGHAYAAHDIGLSVLFLPVSALATSHLITAGVATFLYTLVDPLFGAGLVAVFAAFCLALGASRTATVAATVTAALTTPLWVYSHLAFDAVPTAFFVLLGALGLWRFRESGGTGSILLAGCAAGAAVLVREDAVLFVAIACGWALHLAWKRRTVLGIRNVLAWVVPLALAGTVTLVYDQVRFGSLFDSGHGHDPQVAATTPLLHGLAGLVASPGKGLVFFAPTVLLAVFGARWMWRMAPDLVLLIAGVSVAYLLFDARLANWSGAEAWGPRFLVPIMPLMLLPTASVFDRWRALELPWRALGGLLVAAGFLVQVAGVLTEDVAVDRQHGGIEQQLAWHWDSQIAFSWHDLILGLEGHNEYPTLAQGGILPPPVPTVDLWWDGAYPAADLHPHLRDLALGGLIVALIGTTAFVVRRSTAYPGRRAALDNASQ